MQPGGASNIISFKSDPAERILARLVADAPAYADEPATPFTRVKLAWFAALGLASWAGLGVMLWGLIELLKRSHL